MQGHMSVFAEERLCAKRGKSFFVTACCLAFAANDLGKCRWQLWLACRQSSIFFCTSQTAELTRIIWKLVWQKGWTWSNKLMKYDTNCRDKHLFTLKPDLFGICIGLDSISFWFDWDKQSSLLQILQEVEWLFCFRRRMVPLFGLKNDRLASHSETLATGNANSLLYSY